MDSFISLFSGAGGLDIGLEQAGWQCAYASDIDPAAVATLSKNAGMGSNFNNCFVEVADVTKLSAADVLAKAGIGKGKVRLLAGGPPCQSWSSAGHQLGFSDPRGQLFRDYVRLANCLDVELLVFENVRGLLTARGNDGEPGSALRAIREELLNSGFQTSVHLLNAADFGVPQRRVRLVLVGYRQGSAPAEPVPTHAKEPDLLNGKRAWVSLGDCIRTIDPVALDEVIRPTGKMATELAEIEPGSGVKSRGKIEATRPGGHWGYKQGAFVADLNLPARTVTASGQQDWIRDPAHGLRRLTPRECAAIQSFPNEWQFVGNRSQLYKQIGNAVPPLLARSIGEALIDTATSSSKRKRKRDIGDLMPLPDRLEAAIKYTKKEELRNGPSRKLSPKKRRVSSRLLTAS